MCRLSVVSLGAKKNTFGGRLDAVFLERRIEIHIKFGNPKQKL